RQALQRDERAHDRAASIVWLDAGPRRPFLPELLAIGEARERVRRRGRIHVRRGPRQAARDPLAFANLEFRHRALALAVRLDGGAEHDLVRARDRVERAVVLTVDPRDLGAVSE